MENQLYDILNINRNASFDDIHNSYILLKNKFKEIKNTIELNKLFEAYNILSFPQSRKLYDCGLLTVELNEKQIDNKNTNVLCENLFLKQFFKNNKNKIYTGANINYNVSISLAEAFKGCKKTIDYSIKYPCKQCCLICTKCNGQKYTKHIKNVIMGINTTSQIPCDLCDSTGYIYESYSNIKCSFCNGKKEYISFVDTEVITPQKILKCNNCNGTKKYYKKIFIPIIKKNKCSFCSGTKIISTKTDITGSLSFSTKKLCDNCNHSGFINENTYHPNLTKLDDKPSLCELCDCNGNIITDSIKNIIKKEIITQCKNCKGKGFQLIKKKNICTFCNNNFFTTQNKIFHLNLFPGVSSGYSINIKKCGEQLLYGDPGSLIITVNITENSLYTRINENLKLTLLIHFVKTITGSIYKITLPSQEILTLNTKDFNEIINPTKLFILKNKGMPVYNIESKSIISYGDLFIQFNVIYGKLKSNISNDDIAKIEHFFSKIYEEIDASQNNNIKIINDLLL
jgi:DnaJ-class molecular chaperone